MGDFKTRGTFEKAFRKTIPNFDETIMHFEHGKKMYEGCKIKFVLEGKLVSMDMWYGQYFIDLWAAHFIEFFETGKFDYNQYWIPYGENKEINEEHLVPRKIPLCSKFGNQFYVHSKECSAFSEEMRKIYPGCGFKHIGKKI